MHFRISTDQQAAQQRQQKNTPIMVTPCPSRLEPSKGWWMVGGKPWPTIVGGLDIKLCQDQYYWYLSALWRNPPPVHSWLIHVYNMFFRFIGFQPSKIIQGGEGFLPQYGMTWNDMEYLVWFNVVPLIFMVYNKRPSKSAIVGVYTV